MICGFFRQARVKHHLSESEPIAACAGHTVGRRFFWVTTPHGRRRTIMLDWPSVSEPDNEIPKADFYCPKCQVPVSDPLVCGDCSALICRRCGTPLERIDDLGIG